MWDPWEGLLWQSQEMTDSTGAGGTSGVKCCGCGGSRRDSNRGSELRRSRKGTVKRREKRMKTGGRGT